MNPLNVLTLNGAPRPRGQIYGESLRAQIRAVIAGWKESLGKSVGVDPSAYLAEFIARTNFQSAIQQWTPDIWEEVVGLAEGAGLDFADVYAFQLADEEWLYRRNRKSQQLAGGEHCSSLGICQPNRPPIVAQNMDVPAYYDGYQTVLHIRHPHTDREELIFTAAGLIALNGLNQRGVGVCVNSLMQLDCAAHGLPVAFVIRGLLERDFTSAVDFVQNVPHASGQNYIIGGAGEVADFECAAGKVTPFDAGKARVVHTNHPLANDTQQMYNALYAALPDAIKQEVAEGQQNTTSRYAWLERHAQNAARELTIADIKTILSATKEAPVCVERGDPHGITLGCTVMELTAPPVLHLSPGPPSQTDFVAFTFS
jgi:predicted choloylglycine hydrolase